MSGTGETPSTAIYTTYHSLAVATKIIAERDEEIAELIRERDEAREELREARGMLQLAKLAMLAEGDGAFIEAEQRGYRRGVQDAAKVAEPYEFTAKKILALLEKDN